MKISTKIFSAGAVALCFLFAGHSFGQDEDPTNELNTGVSLNGTTLKVTDAGGDQSVDLSPLQDGTGTDDQELDLNGTTLSIEDGNTVNLSSFSSHWTSNGTGIENNNSGKVTVKTSLWGGATGTDATSNVLKVESSSGHAFIGAQNPGFFIFETDRQYFYFDSKASGLYEHGTLFNGRVGVASGGTSPHQFTVRGGAAYFNANPHNGSVDSIWSTAVIIGVNEQDADYAKTPNREMRFVQGGEIGSGNYGAGIAFGLAPIKSGSNAKWELGTGAGQGILIRYLGGHLWFQGQKGNSGTQFTDSNDQGWAYNVWYNGSSGNNLTHMNNLVRISGNVGGTHPLGVYGKGWSLMGWVTYSDMRGKEDIKTIDNATDKIMALRGTTYKYRGASPDIHYGFIAQELKEVLPELVSVEEDGEHYGVHYDGVTPVLVEAFKELNEKNKAQEEKIAMLERKLSMLEGNNSVIGTSSANLSSGSELSEAAEVISLEQNSPNPFSESTMIEYFLPESVNQAMIFIYDMNGKQLKEMPLMEKRQRQRNHQWRRVECRHVHVCAYC